jgi:hypothetical protein
MRTYPYPSRPSSRLRTTCDICDKDYAEAPERCITVMVRTHPHYGRTLCLDCVPSLEITGCAYRDGEPAEYIFGTARPPRGWSGRVPSAEQLLNWLANGTYHRPKPPRQLERIDIGAVVGDLWRVEF